MGREAEIVNGEEPGWRRTPRGEHVGENPSTLLSAGSRTAAGGNAGCPLLRQRVNGLKDLLLEGVRERRVGERRDLAFA